MSEQGQRAGLWSSLVSDFALRRLPATVSTGLVLAMVNALLGIALMSLIFRDGLEEALPMGIGLGLAASAVLALVIALGSSFSGMYAGIQDASAAILALSAASIATSLVGPGGGRHGPRDDGGHFTRHGSGVPPDGLLRHR